MSMDYPRLNDGAGKPVLVYRDDPTCVGVPEDKQDEAFLNRCVMRPVDTRSNILLGMTERNYRNLALNIVGLRTYAQRLENVLTAYEKQVDENNRRANAPRNGD